MSKTIPFNGWSRQRIQEGRKFCTSRHIKYIDDNRVEYITEKLEWGLIKRLLWQTEGANSPEELQEVIEKIYNRKVPNDEKFFVHFGDFSKEGDINGRYKNRTEGEHEQLRVRKSKQQVQDILLDYR